MHVHTHTGALWKTYAVCRLFVNTEYFLKKLSFFFCVCDIANATCVYKMNK